MSKTKVPKLLLDSIMNSNDNIMICGKYNDENTITETMKALYKKSKERGYSEYYIWTKDITTWNEGVENKNEFCQIEDLCNIVKNRISARHLGQKRDGEVIVFIDSLEICAFLTMEQNSFIKELIKCMQVAQSVGVRFVLSICNPNFSIVRHQLNTLTPTLYVLNLNTKEEYQAILNGRDTYWVTITTGDTFVIHRDCKQRNEDIEITEM